MGAPTYSLSGITATSVSIKVTNPDGYYLHVVCRRADATDAEFDKWVGNATSYSGKISGLEPETSYVVNVGYNETGEGGATFVGAKTFTTEAEEEEPAVGGTVHIYRVGVGWGTYAPYIYRAGVGWAHYAPYIYLVGVGWAPYS